jgi:hypothetical protein
MRRQDWAVLAFRLVGATFVAYGVIGLASLPVLLTTSREAGIPLWGTVLGLLPAWLTVSVGGAFWIGGPSLAARVFPDVPPPDFAEPLDVNSVLQVALALLGAYFVLEAIPLLVQSAGLYVYARRMSTLALGFDAERQSTVYGASAQAALLGALARAAVGFALFLNRARLAAHLKPTRVVNPFAEDEPSEPPAS